MEKSKDEIKKFYDEATIRKLSGFIYGNNRVEYAWQTLNSLFGQNKFNNILEIGSGIGEICHRIKTKFSNARVTGFDISVESIEISEKLFGGPLLTFKRADSISELELEDQSKFDLIFLMDVFEHIPLDERKPLSDFIRKHISEKGFLFFSCPTPQHLSYLKRNIPSEIQPVDEDITLDVLIQFSKDCNLRLVYYKEISVWRAGDYLHVVFSNQFNMQPFSDYHRNFQKSIGLKRELLRRLGFGSPKRMAKVENEKIEEKKQLLREKLGEDIFRKVENFK
ncbi:MAG: class I SAM-dependent methyltransferase [Chitinophagaceae bacterium]|nr:class I SAM-dependent methyltransferase [Chitinophagaceae bacterium]MCO6496353.1 class I SAM-dependent methyltransferase [Chitinophagaceae bacterium]MCZ2397300.1 class I SAM-dependent methyltransferase [Chitinophagales bacterium]